MMAFDQLAPTSVAELGEPRRGADDVGEEDGCEHSVRLLEAQVLTKRSSSGASSAGSRRRRWPRARTVGHPRCVRRCRPPHHGPPRVKEKRGTRIAPRMSRTSTSAIIRRMVAAAPGLAESRQRRPALDVEADVQHVAVLDDVGLPLEALPPVLCDLGMRAELDEVAPVDDLAADEAARDVGVDRTGRVERRLAVPQRPGARVLLAGREERDQVERACQPARDLVERRVAAVAVTRPPRRPAARRARPPASGRSHPGR